MSDFWQRYGKIVLIGVTIAYILSIALWLTWMGALLLGAGYGSAALTVLAKFSAILYPVMVIAGLSAGWWFQHRNQAKKSIWAIVIPVLYVPIMVVIGFIAMIEGA